MSSEKKNRRLWLILPALIILVSALAGSVIGKYIKTRHYSGTLVFHANLAETFLLEESKALRQPDGSYLLDAHQPVPENQYTLLPGLDIPKDPHVVITGKTAIEAYLYVEVVDTTAADVISWSMCDDWLKLEDVTGMNGGVVYVYSAGTDAPSPLTRQEGSQTICLLEDNTIHVSQNLLEADTPGSLKFYASMGEVSAAADGTALARAAAVYNGLIKTTP